MGKSRRRFYPRKRRFVPLGTLAIALAALGVGLYQAIAGWPQEPMQRWGLVPERFWSELAQASRWWRTEQATAPALALFFHAGWTHLLGNLVYWSLFAPRVERRLGPLAFLLFVVFCGTLAIVFAAWRVPTAVSPIIGLSGAVSALLGAYLGFFPRSRIGVILPLGLYFQFLRIPATILIGSWFIFQVLYTLIAPAIGTVAWWTHIAGFVGGLVLALPLRLLQKPLGEVPPYVNRG